MKHFLTLLLIFILFPTLNGQDKVFEKSKEATSIKQTDSLRLSVNIENVERLERILEKKEPNWFSLYGTMIVALVALFGAILTSILSNRRSKINTQLQIDTSRINIIDQLTATQNNLLNQIEASRTLELEKKNLELQFKLKTELKENVAKFINKSTELNGKLIRLIYLTIEDGSGNLALQEYQKTNILRQEITDLFYSIKVSLDGSEKQRQLEDVLDTYMDLTCFNVDLFKLESSQFEQPIKQLYHKIKSIIHDNYQEPLNTSK